MSAARPPALSVEDRQVRDEIAFLKWCLECSQIMSPPSYLRARAQAYILRNIDRRRRELIRVVK